MSNSLTVKDLIDKFVIQDDHSQSDYFQLIRELLKLRDSFSTSTTEYSICQNGINDTYKCIENEIITNEARPVSNVKFGTSGWRGIIGKDIYNKSVAQVAQAIVQLYSELDDSANIAEFLGVSSSDEAKKRGCVLGFDNRFGGKILANQVRDVLTSNGFHVYYAGEATTGTLSASLLLLNAAFSINLTPSHNPLEYGGFKFNAADGGPAASKITDKITSIANTIITDDLSIDIEDDPSLVKQINALELWKKFVKDNVISHGLNIDEIIEKFNADEDLSVAVDCVHGASRLHMASIFNEDSSGRLQLLRCNSDPTFGGIAPEPSSENMKLVVELLKKRTEPLKLGAIIDPDGDRIRFTDGNVEISMNHFGAMAYYYLHEIKKKSGMVAKTVATSNFANSIAGAFLEEVFEPRVGFKEFKPVIGEALVCFEESDGITVIGHTPEKDAYIGLLIALDMVLTLRKNLGDIKLDLEDKYGFFYPAAAGVKVNQLGDELKKTLEKLKCYKVGTEIKFNNGRKKVSKVIDIDGRKMILEDGSWILIRPSGTEPKVRFYVEARNEEDNAELLSAARNMLTEIGLT